MSPYSRTECRVCDRSGYNPATRKLANTWYPHQCGPGETSWFDKLTQDEVDTLVAKGRLMDFTHTARTPEQVEQLSKQKDDGASPFWLKGGNGYHPTADEVNAWSRSGRGIGHDSINRHICIEARAKRLGVYGECPVCHGHGEYWCDDKFKKLADAWEAIEPPAGEGYQVWETVSEGSPVTPVFATPEELADWLAANGDGSRFRHHTKEAWLSWIVDAGWAPSLVVSDGVMSDGIER